MQIPEQIRERSVQAEMTETEEVKKQIAQLAEDVVVAIFRESRNPDLTARNIEYKAEKLVTPEFIQAKFPGSNIQPADVLNQVYFLAISKDRRPLLFARSQSTTATQ